MNKNKNLWKKGVVVAAAAAMITGVVPSVNAFAYGAYDVSQSTFKTDTDNSADFQNWVSNVWQGGEGAFPGTDQVALISDAVPVNTSAAPFAPTFQIITAGIPLLSEYHPKFRSFASDPGVSAT